MATSAERTLDLPVPPDVAFDAVCRAVGSLGWLLTEADKVMGIVGATAPPAGDAVALYVQPTTASESTVIVRPTAESASRQATRLVDQLADAIRYQASVPLGALPPPPPPPPHG